MKENDYLVTMNQTNLIMASLMLQNMEISKGNGSYSD